MWRFGKWLEELRGTSVSMYRKRLRERPYLYDAVFFLPKILELCDAKSDETKTKRPFGLKEFFAGLVELGLRFDPAIERFGSSEHLIRIKLVLQRNCPARPPSAFHVVFKLARDVLELLQDLFFIRRGLECSISSLETPT